MIFTLIFAVTAGWLGRWVEKKRRERTVVDEIISSGGQALYDYQEGYEFREPTGPGWLRKILGENFFSEVDDVTLNGTPNGGPTAFTIGLGRPSALALGLDRVKEFSHLRKLRLYETDVSDAALVNLGTSTELQELDLHGADITNAGLQHLRTGFAQEARRRPDQNHRRRFDSSQTTERT